MKKIKSVICFLKGLWLTIRHMVWVSGHDFVELGRKAGDPRYMKTLECKTCGHTSVGWSANDHRIGLGLDFVKCQQCNYPYPPPPPDLRLIGENGVEFKRDGWGVPRDKDGNSRNTVSSIGIVIIVLIVISVLVLLTAVAYKLGKIYPWAG